MAMQMTMWDVPDRDVIGFAVNPSDFCETLLNGKEVFGFTDGQIGITDVILAFANRIKAARMILSTWTAAKADMGKVYNLLDAGKITAARWIVDRSFKNRQPELCDRLRHLFGDEAIRVGRVHAKFCMLQNDKGLS